MIQKLNWNAIPTEQVNPMMVRQMIYGKEIMIVKMSFKDGFEVPWHQHPNEQISQIFKGICRFWLANQSEFIDLNAGEILVIPANVAHKALMIGAVEAVDTFSPPRQDWLDGTDNYLKK